MAASGSTTPKNTNTYIQGRIYWVESNISNENNTSKITGYLQFRRTNEYRDSATMISSPNNVMSLTVAGETVNTKSFSIATDYVVNQWYTALSKSVTVTHSTDGSKSVNVSASTTSSAAYFAGFSGSTTATLTTIPRNSTITAFAKFTIEDKISFSYKDFIGDKSLTLTCKMGDDTICTRSYTSDVGSHDETVVFSADELSDIYTGLTAKGTTVTSETFTLTLATDGITSTSSKSATGSLAASSNKPTVSIPVLEETDSKMMSLGVTANQVIRYLSKKKVSADVTPRNGAVITNVKVRNGSDGSEFNMIRGTGDTYTATISSPTNKSFIVKATDSRGFSTESYVNGRLVEYSKPAVTNIDFDRDSAIVSSGFIRPSGFFWNGSVGSIQNSVTWGYTITSASDTGLSATTLSTGAWSGSVTLPDGTLDRESPYVCTVTVTDALGQAHSATVAIGAAELSVWIGKKTVKAEGFVGEHYIGVFPVGSIYMSINETNPSTYFGGTWVQIAKGRTIVGVGSIEGNNHSIRGSVTAGEFSPVPGQMGGEVNHTLTIAEMPEHRHRINQIQSNEEASGYSLFQSGSGGFTDRAIVRAASETQNRELVISSGESGAHNNLMPYLAVYIWQRTA